MKEYIINASTVGLLLFALFVLAPIEWARDAIAKRTRRLLNLA